ncbi:YlmC/YmxH family sporulation protein [Pseudoflavonifractor capillosus]|uniref:YlmC/YmxH family sporulation protein n=1 Tax=Pseudoflavonifractor capillosus TaxID=106588 RepID=UPI001959784E|nr:YlmC/YmxH family sporulation protein [Pseudoflavonifractor capillosus]
MICSISELQYKEIIDIADGTRYGYIGDVEIDVQTGAIQSVIISGRPRLFGLLGREPDTIFPWSSITRFGEDLILVDGSQRHTSADPSFKPKDT